MVTGSGVARSQFVLNYGVLAPLCDPILDRSPDLSRDPTSSHLSRGDRGLCGYSIREHCARGHRQLLAASKAQGRRTSEPSTLPRSIPRGYTRFSQAPEAGSGEVTERRGGQKRSPAQREAGRDERLHQRKVSSCGTNSIPRRKVRAGQPYRGDLIGMTPNNQTHHLFGTYWMN